MLLRYCLNDFEMVSVAPIITGVLFYYYGGEKFTVLKIPSFWRRQARNMVWRWAMKKAACWEVDCWQCASDVFGKQQCDGVFITLAGLHWGENFEVNSGDGCMRSIQ
jgi:hypothetical protein